MTLWTIALARLRDADRGLCSASVRIEERCRKSVWIAGQRRPESI